MRLRRRLTLYLGVIILAGSAASVAFARLTLEGLFRSFVFSGESAKAKAYASLFGEYYSAKGGWAGAQAFLLDIPRQVSLALESGIRGENDGAIGPISLSSYPLDTIRSLLADRIAVADSGGVIVADTSGTLLGTVHPARHLAHGYPIRSAFTRVGTVLVGSMVDSSLSGIDERFLSTISASILWATLGSGLLALLLGLLFAGRLSRPLASLSAAAGRVAAGDLSTVLEPIGDDEIAMLATSFNAMTVELRRLEEAKKRVIADAAHELRTPVTLIQGSVEAMLDGIYPLDLPTLRSMHEEILRLSRLIDALRELESIESGELILDLKEVDALELVRKAVALFAAQASAKAIELWMEESISGDTRLLADPLRIGELVDNLIANAIKYSPRGSRIRVAVRGEAETLEGGFVRVSVEDSGPGIPPSERERIFERFYRIDPSRAQDSGGRGLGLAIASEIAKAHGGRIEAGDSELGGAAFVVLLPRIRERNAGLS